MAKDLFTEEEKDSIFSAIQAAELKTSGEVQVHIERHCDGDAIDRASELFAILKMHKTKLRNGVLFYMATKDFKFAILGDSGINEVVPDDFWDDIKDEMRSKFQKGEIARALAEGIVQAGEKLGSHFPYQDDDINELPDEISFGEDLRERLKRERGVR